MPLDYAVSGGVTNWQENTTLGEDEFLNLHAATDEQAITASLVVVGTGGTNGPYEAVVCETNIWATVALFPGTNQLSLVVSDAAGNQTVLARTIIRDTNFVLRITSPGDLAVQNAGTVQVSGLASTFFRTASISVNGINALVTDTGSNVTFTTTSPVPLNVGLTPLVVVAVVNGRSYQADPRPAGYKVVFWHHDYLHKYDGLLPDEAGYWISDYSWTRDDVWDAETKTTVERRIHHLVDTFFWNAGGAETDVDDADVSNAVYRDTSITSAFFGFEDVRDQYVGYGRKAWDHDHLTIQDEVTFIKVDERQGEQSVILQFEDMTYLGNPTAPPTVNPASITFWGQPGFWCKGNVSFIVPIETFRKYTITESDFTWPSFQFNGPRTDMQSFYTASRVASTRHLLSFSDLENQPEPMEFIEGNYQGNEWAAVWCKLDLGPGNISARNQTVHSNPRVRIADYVSASTQGNGNTEVRYSAAINGSFFFWTFPDLNCDTSCSSLQGFVGRGSALWTCGNSTKNLPNSGNRWGFGISSSDPLHIIAHDVADETGYYPAAEVQQKPFGLNNVGLLFKSGTPCYDESWAEYTERRARSLLAWSKDSKHLFMIVLGYHEVTNPKVTWSETIEFIRTDFTREMRKKMPQFAIGDAVMLDGGTSTQLSFRRVVGGSTPPLQKDWLGNFQVVKCVPTLVHAYANLPQN